MLRHYQNLLLAGCLLLVTAADAQTSMNELAAQFIEHIRTGRKEKLMVLTDKPYYAAGEKIWFNAWCLDSLSNRFLYLSKNLYVDLVNDQDSVISQLLFNIPAHKTAGMILLPATLPEGYYWLRAYTTRMLTEDSSRIFVRPVYVVNINKPNPGALSAYAPKTVPVGTDTAAPSLLFYPEGGSIISGTTATVGFRALGSRGQPVDVSGYVTDPLHDTVARFHSVLPGTGKFSFDAYNPRKYTAHVSWRGRELLFPLPALNQFAYQLSVIGRDDRIIHLQVSLGDSLYKKNKSTKLLAVSRDSLCFAANGTDMYQVNVPVAALPPGKVSFYLFDDRDRMVSQRSVYVPGRDSGRLQAATDKAHYGPGEKVGLSIGVRAEDNHPQTATLLAVAVTDDRLTGDRSLNAELGEVAPFGTAPADLAGNAGDTGEDVLMLTAAPSYSGWKYLPGETRTVNLPRFVDSNLLNIRGKAIGNDNAPLQHYIVNLVSGDNRFFMADTTDTQGRFSFPLTEYDDGTRFNMKLTTLQGKAATGKLIIDKMDYPAFRTPAVLKQGLGKDEIAIIRRYRSRESSPDLAQLKDTGLLKPATVKGRSRLPPEDEAKRASSFSDVIGPDQLHKGGVDAIKDALASVPGLTSAINRVVGLGTADPVLVLLDGVPQNAAIIESLDASNIEFIEVLKGPLTAVYGMQGSGGVILINSVNKSEAVAQTNAKGLTTIYPRGYYSRPNVYASGWDPAKGPGPGDGTVDASTLYWNGDIVTDNNGKAKVDFFTGRQQAVYSAAIVGITMAGQIVEGKIKIRCQ
ncbi:MAG TPA: TonB-dependent receptor plug domain-containing protein [Puia sp.]|nr:TonB-dependent receptor plug domain-containing protein [Puia sp.]